MISCKASEAPELYELATLIAFYSNPQCHADLKDIDLVEQVKMLDYLKNRVRKESRLMCFDVDNGSCAPAVWRNPSGSGVTRPILCVAFVEADHPSCP